MYYNRIYIALTFQTKPSEYARSWVELGLADGYKNHSKDKWYYLYRVKYRICISGAVVRVEPQTSQWKLAKY